MTETIYHGAHTCFELHIGQCWTDDESAARVYAERGDVASIEIDWSGLEVAWVEEAYDPETDDAPGDTPEQLADYAAAGIDVIWYEDADARGAAHDTYRIVSERALEAFRAAAM